MSSPAVIFDCAGGQIGGAARWHAELRTFLANEPGQASLIGQGRRLTPAWLARREVLARRAGVVVAPNNASFSLSGRRRVVIAVNALHYLYPDEQRLLDGFSVGWRTQIPVVRRLLPRADVVVAPSSAMAARITHHVPQVADRIRVRMHPVTGIGPLDKTAHPPALLVPIVPGPYKNLFEHLRPLLVANRMIGNRFRIYLTAHRDAVPPDVAADSNVTLLGIVDHATLVDYWRRVSAIFFPSALEAFGLPLAEARVYGIPVIAPRTAHAEELAGPALVGYAEPEPDQLADALEQVPPSITPDPAPFDNASYFRWLIGGHA